MILPVRNKAGADGLIERRCRAPRSTADASGFFILSQSGERPER
jgi:hypothetical protein